MLIFIFRFYTHRSQTGNYRNSSLITPHNYLHLDAIFKQQTSMAVFVFCQIRLYRYDILRSNAGDATPPEACGGNFVQMFRAAHINASAAAFDFHTPAAI